MDPSYDEVSKILHDTHGDINAVHRAFQSFKINKSTRGNFHTCLERACFLKNIEMIHWLIKAGAKITKRVLFYACASAPLFTSKPNKDLVAYLLSFKHVRKFANTSVCTGKHMLASTIDLATIQLLIAAGANVNKGNVYNNNILIHAATHARLDTLSFVLPLSKDVNRTNTMGMTALHCACSANNNPMACIQKLLAFGAEINKLTVDNTTPLELAICKQSLDVLQLLIKEGAHVRSENAGILLKHITLSPQPVEETKRILAFFLSLKPCLKASINEVDDCGLTPIFHSSHPCIAQQLINAGARLDIIGDYGQTPLMYHCAFGRKHMVAFLLPMENDINRIVEHVHENNANVHSLGNTALHYASDYVDIVRLLLDADANINASNDMGITPLYRAAVEGNIDVMALLIENDANVLCRTVNDFTLLHNTLMSKETCSFLLTNNQVRSLIDARTFDARTPLMMKHRIEIVHMLVAAGADVNAVARGHSGLSVLIHTCRQHTVEHVAYLIPLVDHIDTQILAEDVHATHKYLIGRTALHIACSMGHCTGIVQALITGGADINAIDGAGNTPLHLAILSGSIDIVHELVCAGTSLNVTNNNDQTQLELARSRRGTAKNDDVFALLYNEHVVWKTVFALGPWRPNAHRSYPPAIRCATRTIHILAYARPHLSLAQLCEFLATKILPIKYTQACFHLLPEEILQYIYTFITDGPYTCKWLRHFRTCI